VRLEESVQSEFCPASQLRVVEWKMFATTAVRFFEMKFFRNDFEMILK